METTLFLSVWAIAVKLLLPMIGAILLGAVLASVLRIWTQLDDQAVSFVGRAVGLIVFLLIVSGSYFRPILEFTEQTWGNSIYYR